MVRSVRRSLLLALSLAALAASPLPGAQAAGGAPAAQADDEGDTPTPAPLTVGSMAIASDSDLVIAGMALDVSAEKVVYAYGLTNKGKNTLALAASIALPDLEVSNEGNAAYDLPADNAENPVGLAVSVDGKLVPTQAYTQAVALGIDRLADLKAAQLPLIPFGEAIDKALAAAKPETIAKLEGLGLVTPRDASQTGAPVVADWSLHVVHGWTLTLEPGATRKVLVGFAPVKAVYTIDAQSLAGFDALKDQVCLTPKITEAAKALLKAKGSAADVVDITLASDGPARWLDNPDVQIAVHKPKSDSVVAFCGLDAASADKPVVTGRLASSSEAVGLRVLIFSRSGT